LSAETKNTGSRARNSRRARAGWFAATIASLLPIASCNRYQTPVPPGTLNFLIESAPINLDPRFSTDAQSQDLEGAPRSTDRNFSPSPGDEI
jgi:hypothetical protein